MSDSTNAMIRVVAPATLKEGFSLDVMVDDEPFTVLVPQGGVKEGEEFDVPYKRSVDIEDIEDDDETSPEEMTLPLQSSSEAEDEMFDELGAPLGHWRTHLCACCDVVTQATFWIGFCCTPVLLAQLLTRLRLTWKGEEGTQEETSLTFNRIVIAMIVALSFARIPILGSCIFLSFLMIVVVYAGSNLRRYVRKRYKIRPTLPMKCGEGIEDCCCMFWCSCCSAIQIARHTHDDKEFPGYGCTSTGLDMTAPLERWCDLPNLSTHHRFRPTKVFSHSSSNTNS
jgi:Cys-rich protein (TIGR01571 family)